MGRFFSGLAVAVAIAFVGSSVAAAGSTLTVPDGFPTIQAALDAASPGDAILVSPGTYAGPIDFHSKAVTLVSTGGASATTIDAHGAGTVVTINANPGETPVLRGFTVTGGANGGVTTTGGPALIESNSIVNNAFCDSGGGVDASFSAATIRGNLISGNYQAGCSGGAGGGGVFIGGAGTVQLLGNTISGNSDGAAGGGVSLFAAGNALVDSNTITNNTGGYSGGGIDVVNGQSQVAITNNVITGNTAAKGGGISVSVPYGDRGAFVFNNTLVGNSAASGTAISMGGFDAQAEVANNILQSSNSAAVLDCDTTYQAQPPIVVDNDVRGTETLYGGSCVGLPPTNGNFSADPLFVNAAAGDFRLQPGSPAIDAGTNSGAPTHDFAGSARPLDGNGDGVAVTDVGAYEAPFVDRTPPRLTLPAPVTVQATSNAGATVTYTVSASDPDDAAGPVGCTPASGSLFPIGVTTVSCSSTDTHGNVGTGSFAVTVVPIANPDHYSVASGGTLVVAAPGVLANDVADQQTQAAVSTAPASGSLTLGGNGSLTYVPSKGFVGTLTFGYVAKKGGATSAPATVILSVTAPGADCNLADYPRAKDGTLTLRNAILGGCYLVGANLAGANMTGANLQGADLAGANLSGARLTQANLTGAILSGAVLTGVTWSQTTCPDGTSSNRNGGTCIGHL